MFAFSCISQSFVSVFFRPINEAENDPRPSIRARGGWGPIFPRKSSFIERMPGRALCKSYGWHNSAVDSRIKAGRSHANVESEARRDQGVRFDPRQHRGASIRHGCFRSTSVQICRQTRHNPFSAARSWNTTWCACTGKTTRYLCSFPVTCNRLHRNL